MVSVGTTSPKSMVAQKTAEGLTGCVEFVCKSSKSIIIVCKSKISNVRVHGVVRESCESDNYRS